MENKHFQDQIRRLKSVYSDKAYPTDRVMIFWRAFATVPDEIFTQAVDNLIANNRTAPMFEELETSIAEARAAIYQSAPRSNAGLPEILSNLQQHSIADRDFSKACLEHLDKRLSGRITPQHFWDGCELLDQAARHLTRAGDCSRCPGNGYLIEELKAYRYLFRCTCKIGSARPDKIACKDFAGNPSFVAIPFFNEWWAKDNQQRSAPGPT